MPPRATKRASGETGAVADAKNEADTLDQPIAVDLPDEVKRKFRTPGFQRMRFSWREEDRAIIDQSNHEAYRVITNVFQDAYMVMHRIFEVVREPQIDPDTGAIVRDANDFPVWARHHDGGYIEDFSRLTRRQMEDALGTIVTNLFNWEQQAETMRGEALYAKAMFEERFAVAYDDSPGSTVDDRRATGNKDAAEERYFAIFLTTVSRKADALVRSMDRLQVRLKDLLQS